MVAGVTNELCKCENRVTAERAAGGASVRRVAYYVAVQRPISCQLSRIARSSIALHELCASTMGYYRLDARFLSDLLTSRDTGILPAALPILPNKWLMLESAACIGTRFILGFVDGFVEKPAPRTMSFKREAIELLQCTNNMQN